MWSPVVYALFEVPVGQSVGLLLELRVGAALFPTAKRNAVRHAVGDRLPVVSQIEITHRGVRILASRSGIERPQASRGSVPRPRAHVQGFRPTHNIHRLASEARPRTAQRPFPSASPLVRILYSMLVRRVESVTTCEMRVVRTWRRSRTRQRPRGTRPSAQGGKNDRDFWAVPAAQESQFCVSSLGSPYGPPPAPCGVLIG